MKALNLWVGVSFCITALIFIGIIHVSKAQSSSSEQRILLQLQQQLEFPDTLESWQNWTDFCFLQPTSSVILVCSNGHITELTVIGNKTSPYDSPKPIPSGNLSVSPQTLSQKFSIDSLFTVLTELTSLKKVSLVSLGIWGTLPAKIDRFRSLEMLNISSNFIYGEIPEEISSMISLKSLVLANNLINGSVPDLSSLTNLEEVELSNNQIGPNFPALGTNLISIILRNNSIRSPIPPTQMKNMIQIQRFDLSSNNLVGLIPPFVLSLPSLWYLNLADNQLTGELPENTGCGKRLWLVDISKNLLIGNLPKCIGSDSSKYRRVFSDWNCLSESEFQHPVKFCQRQAIAVIPPVKKGSAVENQKVCGVKLGLIFGVIGGTILIFGTLCSLIWVICKRRNSDQVLNNKNDKSVCRKLPTRPSPIIETSNYVARSMRMPTIGLPPYHSFTIEELEEATNNFDQVNLVTEGSQGQVYKGLLPDGSAVLIKCIKSKEKHSIKSLKQHMEVISQLRHPNLSSVLGHCVMCQDRRKGCTIFVVVEHVANGSLREHLVDWRRKDRLKWPQRMTISMGIARGVHFLHTGMLPAVFGNDLKMENILLDDCLTPKLSNYKIPLPFKVENPNGEKVLTSENSEKEDLYKLGVIMLELLTGKQLTSENQVDELKLQEARGGYKSQVTHGSKLKENKERTIQEKKQRKKLKRISSTLGALPGYYAFLITGSIQLKPIIFSLT
ncbi:putative LRR receptor-like serine/threonine-protein kinase At1g14390 isoform X2 [Silene latifolia]|uniref:putative LRR receptor-like serine/threonine-protein kinase At1g14390 isoform X2 n=1 Tax=Silene latifolia TaxID=37657 RepID=UPI003D77104B